MESCMSSRSGRLLKISRLRLAAAKALWGLVLLTNGAQSNAQQIVEVEAEQTISVSIPADGLTLFRTEGAKLLKARHLQGELAAEADPEKSEVTIQPLRASGVTALFLVTETITIPVNVKIEKGRGAKTVVLRTPSPAPAPRISHPIKDPAAPAPEHLRAIKDIVIAATQGPVNESAYAVTSAGAARPALGALRVFHQLTVTSARGLSGHRYIITNPTDKMIVLDERSLRSDDTVAVALEHTELRAGESTVAVVVQSTED